MRPEDDTNRIEIILIGLLLVIAPVVILWFTIGFLRLAGGLLLTELSLLELVELYVLELILFTAGTYLLFRLRRYAVAERLPKAIDESDDHQSDGDPNGRGATETEPAGKNGFEKS